MAVKSLILTDLLKKQGLALESEELAPVESAEVPEVEEVIEATTEVEADGAAVEEAVEGAEQLEEAAVALEAICLAMESSLKTTRGMGARELAMTQRFAGHVLSSIGVAVPSSYVALESIEDAEALQAAEPAVVPVEAPAEGVEGVEEDPALVARAERTEVALEGFKEMAAKFADALKKMWAKIKEMVMGFWKKMGDWSGIQIKRVNSLKKKVTATKVFKVSAKASVVGVAAGLVGGDNLASADVAKAADQIDTASFKIADEYSSGLVKAFKEAGALPTLSVDLSAVAGIKIVDKDGAYGVEGAEASKVSDKDVELSHADLVKIVDSIAAALSAVARFRSKWKETESAAEAAIRAVEASGKAEGDDAAKAAAKEKSDATRKTMRAASALPVAWGKVVTKSTNTFISYVEKALKAGGGKVSTDGKEMVGA